jgi:hypothetical protein
MVPFPLARFSVISVPPHAAQKPRRKYCTFPQDEQAW